MAPESLKALGTSEKAIRGMVAGAVELVRAKDFEAIADAYTAGGVLMFAGQPKVSGRNKLRDAWAEFIGKNARARNRVRPG